MERRRGQPSVYKLKKIQADKEHAVELYRQGYSLREVEKEMGYSYNWVWKAVQELDKKPQEKVGE